MQPGFAPTYPPQGYPQPQQQFAPTANPAYAYPAQQLMGVPAVPAAPPAPLAQGSIDEFYSQPVGGGGAFLKFELGTTHGGVVARPIGNGDVRQMTTPPAQGSIPQFYKDGRPKFEMVVPLKVPVSPSHLDGLASWAVRGADREELARAMAEAGAPEGPPEAGALVRITCTELRPTRGGIPAKIKQIVYRRPGDVTTLPPLPAIVQPAVVQAPVAAQGVDFAALAAQQAQQMAAMQAAQAAQPVQPQAPAVATTPQQAAQPVAPTAGLTPAQRQLLAQLGG